MKKSSNCGSKLSDSGCSLEKCCHDGWPAPAIPCTADETLEDSKKGTTAACCQSCTSETKSDTCAQLIPLITGKGCYQKCALVWTAEHRAEQLLGRKCTAAETEELATAVAKDLAATAPSSAELNNGLATEDAGSVAQCSTLAMLMVVAAMWAGN